MLDGDDYTYDVHIIIPPRDVKAGVNKVHKRRPGRI